jgi:hypothetical protein
MKTKTKIIKAFLDGNESMTIKDMARTIEADYRITHTAAKRLLDSKIIKSDKVGNSILCRLNQEYCGAEIYLAEDDRKMQLLQDKNLKQLYKDVMSNIKTTMFVMLFIPAFNKVRGINLIFISNEPNFRQKVKQVLDLIPLQTSVEILTEQEFKKVKHDFRKYVILHNIESFYLLKKSDV